MKKVILIALILCVPYVASAQDILRVSTLYAPPMVSFTDGEIRGMAAELAFESMKRAGYTPKLSLMPWGRAVYSAKYGHSDALFYAVYTKERQGFFHYPETPLFTVDIVALKRKGARIVITPDYSGLSEWTLGIGRGFMYGEKVTEFIGKARFERVETVADNDTNFKKLLDSRIDLILIDRALARYFMELPESYGKTDFVRDDNGEIHVFDRMSAYLVFSKKTRTQVDAQRLSDALKSMLEDGTYQTIADKYQ